jgi:hypothetical protein
VCGPVLGASSFLRCLPDFFNDVHLIWSRKDPLVIVNHGVINIMSPIGSLVIVYKYFVTWI